MGSGNIYMKDTHCTVPNEKINFPIFIFRVMVDCIYNLLVCHFKFKMSPTEKIRSKAVKFTGKMRNALTGEFWLCDF